MVVQADPKTRQYKVMAFGSRRLTLRNRKFLRKYTPINTPPGTPTGLQLGQRLGGQTPVQSTMPPPTNAPVIPAPVSNLPTAWSNALQSDEFTKNTYLSLLHWSQALHSDQKPIQFILC